MFYKFFELSKFLASKSDKTKTRRNKNEENNIEDRFALS